MSTKNYLDYSGDKTGDIETQPFFVHIHIPKTGGESFNAVLRNNFGDRFHPHQTRWVSLYPRLNSAQVKQFAERHFGIVATSSHRVSLDLPLDDCTRPIVPIALIRDPVDRFLSLYFFLRFKPWEHSVQKDLLLDDYIDMMAADVKAGRHNSHLFYLMLKETEEAFEHVRDLATRGVLHLIPTKKMARGLERLQRLYPDHFTDITLDHVNTSIKDQDVTDDHRARIAEFMSPYCTKIHALAHDCVEMD